MLRLIGVGCRSPRIPVLTIKNYRKPPHRVGYDRVVLRHTYFHVKLIVVLDPQLLVDLDRYVNGILVIMGGSRRRQGAGIVRHEDLFDSLGFLFVYFDQLSVDVEALEQEGLIVGLLIEDFIEENL